MSIRVIERAKQSGTVHFNKPSKTREYGVFGTYEMADAIIAVAVASPYEDLMVDYAGNPVVVFRQKFDPKEDGPGAWTVTVEYGGSPNQYDLRFNIGTQSVKMFEALEALDVYNCDIGGINTTDVPDFGTSINVTDEKVEGVDVEIGKVEITITKKLKLTTLPATYFITLANMTPSVNHAAFSITWKSQVFVFAKGSLLFRGATISQNSDDDVEITYTFAYSKSIATSTLFSRQTFAAWSAVTTYANWDRVTRNGSNYRSLANANLNNEPKDREPWWEFLDPTTTYNGATTYASDAEVVVGGTRYKSLQAANTNHWPPAAASSTWWQVMVDAAIITVGNSDPIAKEGWTYAWVRYQADVANGRNAVSPLALYLVRLYEYKNFGDLDL